MKRALWAALLVAAAAFVPASRAQEPQKALDPPTELGKEKPAEGEHGNLELWKWANFLVLAGAMGYMIGKNAGPFFDKRSQQIRKDMIEADEASRHADSVVADVDRRLANLETEIAALRAQSQQEAAAETERLSRQTAADIAKIQQHGEREIAAAGKAARLELKRFSAHLAVELAEKRLRDRMTPAAQDAVLQGFVRDLVPSGRADI